LYYSREVKYRKKKTKKSRKRKKTNKKGKTRRNTKVDRKKYRAEKGSITQITETMQIQLSVCKIQAWDKTVKGIKAWK
jgi:hypothetical protein